MVVVVVVVDTGSFASMTVNLSKENVTISHNCSLHRKPSLEPRSTVQLRHDRSRGKVKEGGVH